MGSRLREARVKAGFRSASAAARQFGWAIPTYYGHENATRGFSLARAQLYARAFDVSVAWLFTGGDTPPVSILPVAGYVVREGVVYLTGQMARPHGIEQAELPAGDYGAYALYKIRTEALYPAYRDRELILVLKDPGPAQAYLARDCVIRTVGGHHYLRRLSPGASRDRFYLSLPRAPALVDEAVAWASPIIWTYLP